MGLFEKNKTPQFIKEHQAENTSTFKGVGSEDLYQEDVRLIAKDGKLFYLPQQKAKE